jgi:hypothetical protein
MARDEHRKIVLLMRGAGQVARVRQNLAETLLALGELEEAERIQREILEEERRVLGVHNPFVLLGMNNLAVIVGQRNNVVEQESLLREALKLREEISGVEHPETTVVAFNLAIMLTNCKRLPEAEGIKASYLGYPPHSAGFAVRGLSPV